MNLPGRRGVPRRSISGELHNLKGRGVSRRGSRKRLRCVMFCWSSLCAWTRGRGRWPGAMLLLSGRAQRRGRASRPGHSGPAAGVVVLLALRLPRIMPVLFHVTGRFNFSGSAAAPAGPRASYRCLGLQVAPGPLTRTPPPRLFL